MKIVQIVLHFFRLFVVELAGLFSHSLWCVVERGAGQQGFSSVTC